MGRPQPQITGKKESQFCFISPPPPSGKMCVREGGCTVWEMNEFLYPPFCCPCPSHAFWWAKKGSKKQCACHMKGKMKVFLSYMKGKNEICLLHETLTFKFLRKLYNIYPQYDKRNFKSQISTRGQIMSPSESPNPSGSLNPRAFRPSPKGYGQSSRFFSLWKVLPINVALSNLWNPSTLYAPKLSSCCTSWHLCITLILILMPLLHLNAFTPRVALHLLAFTKKIVFGETFEILISNCWIRNNNMEKVDAPKAQFWKAKGICPNIAQYLWL
jgi:hypothetical protein